MQKLLRPAQLVTFLMCWYSSVAFAPLSKLLSLSTPLPFAPSASTFASMTRLHSSTGDENPDPILEPLLKMSNDALKEELLQRGVKGASGGKVRSSEVKEGGGYMYDDTSPCCTLSPRDSATSSCVLALSVLLVRVLPPHPRPQFPCSTWPTPSRQFRVASPRLPTKNLVFSASSRRC